MRLCAVAVGIYLEHCQIHVVSNINCAAARTTCMRCSNVGVVSCNRWLCLNSGSSQGVLTVWPCVRASCAHHTVCDAGTSLEVLCKC